MAINSVNVALGAILFAAPWLFGFGHEAWASLNARLSGGIVILLALLAVLHTHDWEEWLNVIAGLWIIGAPWMLWFDDVPAARWIHVIVGFCIVAIAAFELYRLYHAPDGTNAERRRTR
ncbi:hypothetical protein BB934_16020 [Microvirga ossetica]|uniref:SPW repeat-containing integral membrane domain-containing protein n=2 Tax=Microvirga ossetica TaxID=1882682 RepID=A0A1B2EPW5_9HYPH|nr:hypothetical protein BB934_16020 [Microvirga ossetica]